MTCLSCEKDSGFLVSAGFADGSVRLYDRRRPNRDWLVFIFFEIFRFDLCSVVQCYQQHTTAVLSTHIQSGDERSLISCGSMGDVFFWDPRSATPLKSFSSHFEYFGAVSVDPVTTMTTHERAPLIAV